MPAPHTTVKHELLVRYLDAWAPAALHGHKKVTYLEGFADRCPVAESSAAAALRVFGEFADLLDRHTLTMVLAGTDPARLATLRTHLDRVAAQYGSPGGLIVRVVAGPELLLPELSGGGSVGSPIFGWFDAPGPDWATTSGWPPQTISTVVSHKASEVMLAVPVDASPRRPTSGWPPFTAAVDLVDEAGRTQRLTFGTPSEKSLETFKDELWALDEYAGIRYRDPFDPEHALLDISLQPHLAPLRRALTTKLHDSGDQTLAQLRSWALHETVYRSGDTTKAVQTMVASGAATREPVAGRLSNDTVIRLA